MRTCRGQGATQDVPWGLCPFRSEATPVRMTAAAPDRAASPRAARVAGTPVRRRLRSDAAAKRITWLAVRQRLARRLRHLASAPAACILEALQLRRRSPGFSALNETAARPAVAHPTPRAIGRRPQQQSGRTSARRSPCKPRGRTSRRVVSGRAKNDRAGRSEADLPRSSSASCARASSDETTAPARSC